MERENDCEGTRLIAFAHRVAAAGIMMPTDVVHLTAGRQYMTDELHALYLFAILIEATPAVRRSALAEASLSQERSRR